MTFSENPILIEDREELIFLLSEASQLEHLIMCEYLFAAFSLKRGLATGLTPEQQAVVDRWAKTLYGIAANEMLHLALVANLHTSLGAFPHFNRPNFPQRSGWFPPGVQLDLTPFNQSTLEHFLFLERPEGEERKDGSDFRVDLGGAFEVQKTFLGIEPVLQEFATVGHLYRGIENGLRTLAEKYGEDKLFIGPKASQTAGDFFYWSDLNPVTDLASALQALDTIIRQGEGGREDRTQSHYGQFLTLYNEFMDLRAHDPNFEPAWPSYAAWLQPAYGEQTNQARLLISEPLTAGISQLFNSCYQILMQMLIRFFVHSGETETQFKTLADCAVNTMFELIEPLGEMLARLPVGEAYPGLNAGANFEIFRTGYILPHQEAAWQIIWERLLQLADFCEQLKTLDQAPPGLSRVATSLHNMAMTFEATKAG